MRGAGVRWRRISRLAECLGAPGRWPPVGCHHAQAWLNLVALNSSVLSVCKSLNDPVPLFHGYDMALKLNSKKLDKRRF